MSQELTLAEQQAQLDRLIAEHRVELPAHVWLHVFDTMRVPEARWPEDARHLSGILTLGRLSYLSDITPREVAMAETSALAGALYRKLVSWGVGERATYEFNAAGLDATRNPGTAPALAADLLARIPALRFRRLEQAVRAVADIAISTTEFVVPRIITCPRERAFDLCVALLCRAAAARGWCVSFSHNTGTGPLVDIIEAVRPHMPDGFVPDPLSMKRLRVVRQRALETV